MQASPKLMPASALVGLSLGTAGVFADMYTTQAILPVLGQDFGQGPAAAGLTVSVVVAGVAVGSLIMGPLSDRVGRKPVMVLASAALVAPTLLCGLAPTFAALVVLRALQGLLMPGLTSVAIPYVNEEFPALQRGTAMGLYVGGQVLGGLLSRGISAALTAVSSWRLALGFFALPTAIGSLALARTLPSTRVASKREGARWSDVGLHLRNPALIGTFLIGGALFCGFIGVFTYLPYYLTSPPFNLPTAYLGLVYLIWITGVLAPSAGKMAMRVGRRRLIFSSLSLVLAGMLISLIPWLPIIIFGLCLVTVGQFSTMAAVNLMLGEVTTVAKGTAAAMYLCCYYLGGTVGGVLPGLAWEHLRWPGVIAITLGTAGVAVAANLTLSPRD